ncbi:hypothetical protein CFC21_041659 [Triticum aestivum]|uniref:Endosulphine n=3 Tax=Triticum TaxID=4564 RepID=A0A9R1JUF5_WHEAT|nr:hypothetical protein CFC21_041659 [Triticum aestivum]
MSGMSSDDASAEVRPEGEVSGEKVEETQDQNEGSGMPSPQEEEAAIKKKYGGKMPKKSSLISKDHERAFFDSADWALGKQGGSPNKPKGPLEALRPKLQPTQQNARARRSAHPKHLSPCIFVFNVVPVSHIIILPAEELTQNDDPT